MFWQLYCKSCAIGLGMLVIVSGATAGAQSSGSRFKVDIQGCPVSSANVESIVVEDLVIDEREMTTGADWDYRVSGPGDAHFGSITIRARVTNRKDELHQWWLDCSQGKNIRKSISVVCLKRDGEFAREWNFHDAFPVRWDAGDYSPSSNAKIPPPPGTIVSIECRYEYLDMWAYDDREGEIPQGVSLIVEDDGGGTDVDSAWESWAGGGVVVIDESHLSEAKLHVTTPGHKYIDTLILRGPVTAGRKALCQWITETVNGKPWKRTLTVTEILKDGSDGKSFAAKDGSGGKTFTYHDCFPTRYVFPAFDVSSSRDLYEEVHMKPIRLELK